MALWHEGGLGDVIDSAHLAVAIRQSYNPDYLAYYLRKAVQNDLVFCLRYDGKPVFDGTLQTDIPWEDCVTSEAPKWDNFIDWKPYVPVEYRTEPHVSRHHRAPVLGVEANLTEEWRTQYRDKPFAHIPCGTTALSGHLAPVVQAVDRSIPIEWQLLYRDMLKSPYLNALHDEKMSLHEIACTALDIKPVSIDELEVKIEAPIRWQLKALSMSPYITIGPGSDTQAGGRQRQTKEWPDHRWEQLVQLLHDDMPKLRILQVGKAGEATIKGTTSLVGKTSIQELLWILKKSRLHLGCENGTVRMARACGVDSVVVFGPTSQYLYGMEHNAVIRSNACTPCFWKTSDWMLRCPHEWDALCMVSTPPKPVADAVMRLLEKADVASRQLP